MKKQKSRGNIKHHEWRIKQKIRSWLLDEDRKHDPRWLGIKLHTRCTCSCCMCGNDRKFLRQKTLKEKSAEEIYKIELEQQ